MKGAPGLGVFYRKQHHTRAKCSSYADWAGSNIDRSLLHVGYCVFVGGNLVSWRCDKKNVASRSNAE